MTDCNQQEYINNNLESDLKSIETINQSGDSFKTMEEIEVNNFSYDGQQVVPAEYFAHRYEPSITFNQGKISLNTACLRRFPDINYIQILINPNDKKMIVKPCLEEEKDSFVWCTKSKKPKHITCKIFFGMIANLMNWNTDYRSKLLGKLIKNNEEYFFLFNLTSYEFYEREIIEGENKQKISRIPKFPEEWKHRFGLSVEEHKRQLQVNIVNDFTIYSISSDINASKNNISNIGEEVNNEQSDI